MANKHELLNQMLGEILTASNNIDAVVRNAAGSLNEREIGQIKGSAEAVLDRLETYQTLLK